MSAGMRFKLWKWILIKSTFTWGSSVVLAKSHLSDVRSVCFASMLASTTDEPCEGAFKSFKSGIKWFVEHGFTIVDMLDVCVVPDHSIKKKKQPNGIPVSALLPTSIGNDQKRRDVSDLRYLRQQLVPTLPSSLHCRHETWLFLTCFAEWEVVFWVVRAQHCVVVCWHHRLWRGALIQWTVLGFPGAEGGAKVFKNHSRCNPWICLFTAVELQNFGVQTDREDIFWYVSLVLESCYQK